MRVFLAVLLVVSLLPYTVHGMSAGEPTGKPYADETIVSDPPGKMVGGPCAYTEYPGKATIVSIDQIPNAGRLDSTDAYWVKFSFMPKVSIDEPHVKWKEKFPLYSSWRNTSGKVYLEKNGIKEGAVFDIS